MHISLGRARDIVSAGRARHVRKGTDSRKTAGRRIGMEGKTVARFPGAGEVAPTLENTGRHCSEMPHGPRAAAAPHPSIASRDLLVFSPHPLPRPSHRVGRGGGGWGEGEGRWEGGWGKEEVGEGKGGGSPRLFFFFLNSPSIDHRPQALGRERERERGLARKSEYIPEERDSREYSSCVFV